MRILSVVLRNTHQTVATTLTLNFDDRQKSRQRVSLDNGDEAGLQLARGTVLRDGDYISDGNQYVVRVVAAPEKLSTVTAHDANQFARLCYHLGNRHVPLQIGAAQGESWARYQTDHVLDDMVLKLGGHVAHMQAVFEPEAGAYDQQAHHSHTHEHH